MKTTSSLDIVRLTSFKPNTYDLMKGIRISSLVEIGSDPVRPNADNPHVKSFYFLARKHDMSEKLFFLETTLLVVFTPPVVLIIAEVFRIPESFGYVVNPLNYLLG